MNQQANEPMNQWFKAPKNRWINEPVDQWLNHWFSEAMNHWSNEPTMEWINESANEPMNEWMNLRMGGWMDERATVSTVLCWATSSLSDLFAEAPPSLSNFFSEQPLTWATSALICLPASSPIASATHFFSSSSRYNAFSTLQLRSRLPGASQHHWCFPARSRANAFCHSRLQTGIAGAPHHVRAALTMGLNQTNLALPRAPSMHIFLPFFIWSRALLSLQSRSRFSDRILPKVSKRLSFWRFLCETELSLQSGADFSDLIFKECFWPFSSAPRCRCSPLHFLSTTFPNPRKQTPYFGEQYIKDVS